MTMRGLGQIVLAVSLLLCGVAGIAGTPAALAQGSLYSNEMAAGRQAFEGSSFPLAERHFQGAIDVASSDTQKATAWYSLGVVSQKQGRTEEARERVQKALALAPNHNQAKALLEELARTPEKSAKGKSNAVTGSTQRQAATEPPKRTAAAASPAPAPAAAPPAPAPREARPKPVPLNPQADARRQAFETGDCDSVKTLDAEIGGDPQHEGCLADAAKRRADAAAKDRLEQRAVAFAGLDCEKVKTLDAEIGAEPRHELCVATLTEKKAEDERAALTEQRDGAHAALKCDEVASLDGRIGDGGLHAACAVNATLRSGSPRELFLAATRQATEKRDLDRAKLLYATIVDRFPADDLAIKAAEQLAGIANAEAVEASNATTRAAAKRVEGMIERVNAERATAPTKEFCYLKAACGRNCASPKTDAGQRCQTDCAAAYARCP